MGCNAWNHSLNCDCGWGGDTGFGWQNSPNVRATFPKRAPPPIRISTTIPNARCPVCHDVVFFYASPFGGRVFFDELGPPWPKHPCTDNPKRAVGLRSASEMKRTAPAKTQWERDGWVRLQNLEISTESGAVYVTGDSVDPVAKHALGFLGDAEFTPDDPVYCRRAPSGTGEFELSYLPINGRSRSGAPRTILVIPDASQISELERWHEAKAGDAEAQNLVGMSISYGRITHAARALGCVPEGIDWSAAEYWFRAAAAQGYWAGDHNLGVMYLHGDGLEKNPALAFHHLSIAAQSGAAASLRRLADLYAEGIGTPIDQEEAARLRARAEAASEEPAEG